MQKVRLYKLIILLLIPLLGIAFIVYRRLSYQPMPSYQQEYADDIPSQTPEMEREEIQESEDTKPSFEEVQESQELAEPEIEDIPAFSAKELETRETPQPVKEVKISKPRNLHEKKMMQKKVRPSSHAKATKDKSLKGVVYPERNEGADIEQSSIKKESTKTTSGLKEIALSDELTKSSFGYKHWSGRYYPSKFILKFDDKVVLTFDGKDVTRVKDKVTINTEKPVQVRFDFEFLGGKRHGWKEVLYQIDKNTKEISLEFDWKDPKDYQIILSPAKPLSVKAHNNHDGK